VPTTRPRHVVTETDPVARALDAAAVRWPAEAGNRARLLLRLVEEGHRAVAAEQEATLRERRAALDRTRGVLTGAFGEGYLEKLREDWPT